MVTRVMQSAVLVVLTSLTLTGCGRQVSKESAPNFDLLATGPAPRVLPTMRPDVSGAVEAVGGLETWKQCAKIEFGAIVKACARDGCFYLTQQDFVLCPWSDAIQVTAHEPRADFVWQVVGGSYYLPQVDPNLDVSPLGSERCDYAYAVLQIVTAPARMLEDGFVLTPRPTVVQNDGQWYLPIDAKYAEKDNSGVKVRAKGGVASHWTQSVFFQDQSQPVVDMVWLGDPDAKKFLIVRGYDYAEVAGRGVKIPTKIEVFQSDPDANIGPRLALVDLKR
jgi:hypothetical protein